jgi:L-lactate dehydrogenase
MPKIVSILGYGNVGQAIVSQLLAATDQHFMINVIDPDEQTYGAFLDQSHAAAFNSNHSLMYNFQEALEVSDYIIHTAGQNTEKGTSRLSVADKNIQLTYQLFEGVKLRKEAIIIVVSNPVDVIAYHTWKASGLNASQIIGTGTMIDAARMKFYLAQALAIVDVNMHTVVVGEHGEHMIPLFNQSTVDGQACSSLLTPQEAQAITKQIKGAATHIRETQPATKYGVAACVSNILFALLNDKPVYFQASVKPDELYAQKMGTNDLFISLPLVLQNNTITIDHQLEIEGDDLKKLQKAALILEPFVKGQPVPD